MSSVAQAFIYAGIGLAFVIIVLLLPSILLWRPKSKQKKEDDLNLLLQAHAEARAENKALKEENQQLKEKLHKMLIADPDLVDLMQDVIRLEDAMRLREESKRGLAQLRRERRNLEKVNQQYSAKLANLIQKVEQRQADLNELEEQIVPVNELMESFPLYINALNEAFQAQYSADVFFESILHDKLNRTWDKAYKIENLEVKASIVSPQGKTYTVELGKCDCENRKYHPQKPCKHMVLLAYTLGFLQYEYVNENTIQSPKAKELRQVIQSLRDTASSKNTPSKPKKK